MSQIAVTLRHSEVAKLLNFQIVVCYRRKNRKNFKRSKKMEEILVKKNKIIEELSRKYNKKKELIRIMFDKCIEMDYDIEKGKEILNDFYK